MTMHNVKGLLVVTDLQCIDRLLNPTSEQPLSSYSLATIIRHWQGHVIS